jgi:hypothetical protein
MGAKNQIDMMSAFKKRFLNELGYRYVEAYPIFKREQGQGRIMFFMIHASNHPEAPKLIGRAYRNVAKPPEPDEQLDMELAAFRSPVEGLSNGGSEPHETEAK